MEKITSRAVLGMFKNALAVAQPPSWFGQIANTFTSDQASEEYAWLDSTPALREWVGGRHAHKFIENSLTISNKDFESTIEVLVKDMRRDKYDMLEARVNQLVSRAMTHPASILSTLIINGESTACYDDQFFFDTDHSEGDSGTISNDISIDISALPAENHGTTTNPSVEELQLVIAQGVDTMMAFKDSAGEPINEDASDFVVMVPATFRLKSMQAMQTPQQITASQTALAPLGGMNISVVANPRLTWTEQLAIFRRDTFIKPFIFQKETAVNVASKAEGSEFEFDNKAHQYGVDYSGNVGYGMWQYACLITMT